MSPKIWSAATRSAPVRIAMLVITQSIRSGGVRLSNDSDFRAGYPDGSALPTSGCPHHSRCGLSGERDRSPSSGDTGPFRPLGAAIFDVRAQRSVHQLVAFLDRVEVGETDSQPGEFLAVDEPGPAVDGFEHEPVLATGDTRDAAAPGEASRPGSTRMTLGLIVRLSPFGLLMSTTSFRLGISSPETRS